MPIFDDGKQTEKLLIKKAQNLQNRKNRFVSFNVIVLSAFGWHLSIPVLIGIGLGRFLDKHYSMSHFSWTLNCILLGFLIGIIQATTWLRREGILSNNEQKQQKKVKLTKDKIND